MSRTSSAKVKSEFDYFLNSHAKGREFRGKNRVPACSAFLASRNGLAQLRLKFSPRKKRVVSENIDDMEQMGSAPTPPAPSTPLVHPAFPSPPTPPEQTNILNHPAAADKNHAKIDLLLDLLDPSSGLKSPPAAEPPSVIQDRLEEKQATEDPESEPEQNPPAAVAPPPLETFDSDLNR